MEIMQGRPLCEVAGGNDRLAADTRILTLHNLSCASLR